MQEKNPLISKDKTTYKSMAKISLMVFNIALSSFYFGYSIVYFGSIDIKTMIKVYDITAFQQNSSKGIYNGCIPIGALIGALSSSIIINKFSRKNCLLFVNAIALVFGGLIYIQNQYTLLICRIVQGFCVGVYSALAPLIIKQLAPTEISGTLGSFAQLNVCIGVFFGSFFTYLLKKITGDVSGQKFWRIQFGFPLLTLVLQTLLLIFVYPYQTPKYLLEKGQEQQAQKLIQIIYKPECVKQILQQKKLAIREQGQIVQRKNQDTILSQASVQTTSSSTNNLLTTVIALHLAILQQFSGINAFAIYGGDIASLAVDSQQLKALMSSFINLEQLLTTLVTGYLLTRFGRKTILQFGAFFSGLSNLLISVGFFIYYSDSDNSISLGQPLILIGLFMYMAVFGLSLGPVVWLYIPEIVQPKIVPFSTASNWISASLIIILFPIITENVLNGKPSVLFLFFAAWSFGSFVFNMFFVIQTKGKIQKVIRQEYAAKKLC